MDYVEALTEMLNHATDSLWRTVKAMPEDKFEWKPEETARSSRELVEEIVMTTGFTADLVKNMKMGNMEEGDKTPKTIAELEKEHRAGVEKLIAAMKAFPVDKLHDTIDLPWGTQTFLQVIAYGYWNLTYHWGQISYVQTMYGDTEMH